MKNTLSPLRLALALLGILAISLSILQLSSAYHGLQEFHFVEDGIPVTVMAPLEGDLAARPLVLIGHGFAASERMMSGYSLSLAHAGYTVAAWDFDGHGGSQRRFGQDGSDLLQNVEQVRTALVRRKLTNNQRVAILGHSLGAGVALDFGMRKPEVEAVVAISPVSRVLTPALPHNLLLMAGQLEPAFGRNAERMLVEAGGEGGDPVGGNARALAIIPGVEHILILFTPTAHQTALAWLDSTFGVQPGARPYVDLRLLWYALGFLGFALASATLVAQPEASAADSKSTVRSAARLAARPGPDFNPARPALGLVAGALAATALLWGLSGLGINLYSLLGVAVGGYLLIWFGLAGGIAGLVSRVHWDRPQRSEIMGGLSAFLALWLGVGWLGGQVWVHWGLNGPRLLLWPFGGLLLLPWMLVVGEAVQRARPAIWAAWWAGHSLVLAAGLLWARLLNPELSFIQLALPLLPAALGLHTLASGPQHSRWAFALSGAAFLSWLLLAVFPIL